MSSLFLYANYQGMLDSSKITACRMTTTEKSSVLHSE